MRTMDTGLLATLIVVGVIVVILIVVGIVFWVTYHSVVGLKTRVDGAWGEIEAQIKDRAAILPTVLEAVRGVAGHEEPVFKAVTTARDESLVASDAPSASLAETHVQKALRGVFAVAEGYPQLQRSQNFLELQSELAAAEDRIQAARRRYNGGVRELNAKIKGFPGSAVARNRGFGTAEYFESAEASAVAEPPRIQF
jgi:LemA protein